MSKPTATAVAENRLQLAIEDGIRQLQDTQIRFCWRADSRQRHTIEVLAPGVPGGRRAVVAVEVRPDATRGGTHEVTVGVERTIGGERYGRSLSTVGTLAPSGRGSIGITRMVVGAVVEANHWMSH